MKTIFKLSLLAMFLPALTSSALTVTNIAPGSDAYHSLFIKSDGSLWVMGYNLYGQLGDGTLNNISRPEQIVANAVTAIAAGYEHSLFLKSDGSLWAMGHNYVGELGDGTFSTNSPYGTNQPEQIVGGGVTAIAAGSGHNLFLKSDGSLWAMGFNQSGQLGDGTTNDTAWPEQIVSSGVTAIAAGGGQSLFLKSDGSLWGMGDNGSGELGDGTFNNTNRPEQIIASGVTAIAAGNGHSLFLKSDGSLWAMGWNQYGQLGDGTYSTNYPYGTNQPEQIVASGVTAIAAGFDHSLFLKSDGSLWAMGGNYYGQLGDGWVHGNGTNQPEQIVASGVTAVAAGYYRSLFLKSDGSLWAMGRNNYGQLGDGFSFSFGSLNSFLPEQIFPTPQPKLSSVLLSATNLQLKATCSYGGNFYLRSSTNIDSPLNLWTPLRTNFVTGRGPNNFSCTLTNAINSGAQRFYILQSQ
jgi:alpha-tubulin suppressor-like RCC1 family protein